MSPSLAQPMASLLDPLELSRWMLFSMGVDIRVHHRERLPRSPFLMISNHRSFLDVPLLMTAAARPVHFACHHYMAQVPVMRNVVDALGCFPLDEPAQRGRTFFKQAAVFLRSQKSIGVFPEGTGPMVSLTPPTQMGAFHRGFAHLALRASRRAIQPDLQVVPAAIIAIEEKQQDTVPFKLLGWFDPTEPLFQQPGLHPAVIYRRVRVVIGEPIAVADFRRSDFRRSDFRRSDFCGSDYHGPDYHGSDYRGKGASQLVTDFSDTCHGAVSALLQAGCY